MQTHNNIFGSSSGNGAFTVTITGDNVSISMKGSDISDLGLQGTDILSAKSASGALDAIKNAMQSISQQRGSIAALSNGLERTKNRLADMEINLTSALSRIEDADIAEEMMNLVKGQVLEQANAYLMAQLNKQPTSVLALLKQ